MLTRAMQRAVSASRGATRMLSASAPPLDALGNKIAARLDEIRAAGTYKEERVITSAQGSDITVTGGQEVINFCANNYLGLANHPIVLDAARTALDTHGFGMASVRFICGTQDIHKELESTIANFHGTESTILYPSCFDANAGIFEALLGPEDVVISDELNHASIIDGVRLCKAKRERYKHLDMEELEEILLRNEASPVKLVVTDGVFSMDGDVAPLDKIVTLCDKHGAVLLVDECHATGFFGARGRGTDEYCGVWGEVDVINSTLGKALGGATGGYTTGRADVVELLRQTSRPYLFSNSIAPSVASAGIAVFQHLMEDSSRVEKVRALTHKYRDGLQKAGFTLSGAYDHPIVPIMLGDAKIAAEMANKMLDKGIYCIAFSFPVVPKGKARIRTQVSAAHTEEDVEKTIQAFTDVANEMNIF